ncbi:hypothetical protein BDN70DRAFT_887277 [Pholiota conissans]|uniref:Uncharacterized protein n=1 Tax=Pholiota conissans TaxID=109636 RepID=A0A9P6CSK6_9AGAR|nr:hypothetical protein BDN70DRAFT_887277 [Pholiota conissans]
MHNLYCSRSSLSWALVSSESRVFCSTPWCLIYDGPTPRLSSSSSRRATTLPARPQSHTNSMNSCTYTPNAIPLEIHTSRLEIKVYLRRSIRSCHPPCPSFPHIAHLIQYISSRMYAYTFIHASSALFSWSYSVLFQCVFILPTTPTLDEDRPG